MKSLAKPQRRKESQRKNDKVFFAISLRLRAFA
jgi:hypothetical protein